MIDLPPPSYEQTVEAVVKCDIPRSNVRIKYEDYLQSDEVAISDLGPLSDKKLRCLKSAIHPYYLLSLDNESQRTAFYKLFRSEDRTKERADALAWLRAKGILNRLPVFDPGQGISAFATAVESACGLKRGSVFQMGPNSSLTVKPDFFARNKSDESSNTFQCLLQMFAASDAVENGVSLGFVGNEQYIDEQGQRH